MLCLSVCHSVVIKNKTAAFRFQEIKNSSFRDAGSTNSRPPSLSVELSPSAISKEFAKSPHLSLRKRTAPSPLTVGPSEIGTLANQFDNDAERLLEANTELGRLVISNKCSSRAFSMDLGDPASPISIHPKAGISSSCSKGGIIYPLSRYNEACYDASSPDELALVCGAKALGVEFVGRPTPDRITLGFRQEKTAKLFFSPEDLEKFTEIGAEVATTGGCQEFCDSPELIGDQSNILLPAISYRILDVLEFDNYRKMMSVIIRDDDGQILLLSKGADMSMLQAAEQGEGDPRYTALKSSILTMSKQGLRTMVFGYKVISELEYQRFARDVLIARRAQDEDDTTVASIIKRIEVGLTIIGSTGVNDTLQLECSETISAIKSAGITLWVLTGDKMETAISIGMSTRLLTENTFNCIINGNSINEILGQLHMGIMYIVSAQMMAGRPIPTCQIQKRPAISAIQKNVIDLTKFTPEHGSSTARLDNKLSRDFSHRELIISVKQYLEDFEEVSLTKKERNEQNFGANRSFSSATNDIGFFGNDNPQTSQSNSGSTAFDKMASLAVYDQMGLTVTGEALELITVDPRAQTLFFALANLCSVVIACRVSPLQKSLVVSLSKRFFSNIPGKSFCSLAIGDGANDVNMIMTASVGVGIAGKEGSQAARTADVVIQEFRHLQHLLLIHGHESVRRNSLMIYHTLWKNTFFGSAAFFYAFNCLYSGVDIYNLWIKQLYNLVFTSIPIMYYCSFDRYLPNHIMGKYSELYPTYSRPDGQMYFGKKWYFWWMILGFSSAAAVTYFPLVIMNWGTGTYGIVYLSLDTYGQTVYTLTVILGCVTVAPFVSCWSAFMIWTPIFALIGYFLVWFCLSNSIASDVVTSWSINNLLTYHAAIFCTCLIILMPLMGWYLARIIFRPSRQTIIQERLRLGVHDLVLGKINLANMALAPKMFQNKVNFVFAEGEGMNRLIMQQEVVHRRGGSMSASGTVTPDSVAA
eukprot:GHVH01014718.1.p1 GENE.GHVH01014718.1~~GHVH01014718.1.p1  ORF type:complete len:984 (+),score=152.73 GHVH01014718.1:1777-4728(+)